ncbi:MAG: RsmE family RNA methyltransferase [Deltaproteobacteria bacterium]|jgi:16S rRNA (uracil1498-N3)-methyltransferase|nr:RsmE family RNA methyltransferase [Deltaproteobacteria bacterium]
MRRPRLTLEDASLVKGGSSAAGTCGTGDPSGREALGRDAPRPPCGYGTEEDLRATDGTAEDPGAADGTAEDPGATDGTAEDPGATDGAAEDLRATDGTAEDLRATDGTAEDLRATGKGAGPRTARPGRGPAGKRVACGPVGLVIPDPEPAEGGEGDVYSLSPREARHGTVVLRLREGDLVEVQGIRGCAPAEVVSVAWGNRPVLAVKLTGPFAVLSDPPPPTVLALAVVRPAAFEWACAKASELGCAVMVPLLTARGRSAGPQPALKLVTKCRLVARESRKQCGRDISMTVTDPMSVPAFLAALGGSGTAGLGVNPVRILADREAPPVLTLLMRTDRGALDGPPAPSPALLIGPEGGLSEREKEEAAAAGFTGASLGPYTLKSETAAAAGLAAMAGYAFHARELERTAAT